MANPPRIGLLTRNRDAWPSTQLRRAIIDKGGEPLCFTFSDLSINLGMENEIIIRDNINALTDLEAIIVRPIGRGSLDEIIFRLDVMHRLERGGILMINPPSSIEKAVDKYYALSLLSENGIKIPKTVICENPDYALKGFKALGRNVVTKPLFGSQGFGVTRLTDLEIARRVYNTLNFTNNVLYTQEYIRHGKQDIRCLVIGGKVISSMKRRSRGWRTNISQGGRPIHYKVPEEVEKIAIKSAEVLGCKIAGVDLLESENGFFVNEVNSQPGFRGLQSVTNIDIAGEMVQFILNELNK